MEKIFIEYVCLSLELVEENFNWDNLDNINESKLLINEAINTYNKVKNEKLIIDLFENKKEKVIIKEDIEMEVTNG